jgi:hypothetical protein
MASLGVLVGLITANSPRGLAALTRKMSNPTCPRPSREHTGISPRFVLAFVDSLLVRPPSALCLGGLRSYQ